MSLRDDLIAAKALIDSPEKWWRNSLSNDAKTCFCAMGAIGEVLGPRVWVSSTPQYMALVAALPGTRRSVPSFNDDPDTTHADIMALFDRAIEAAERSK